MTPSSSPSWRGLLGRLGRLAVPSPVAWRPWSARRALVLAVGVPLFLVAQLAHWAGFLLDEVFFRAYRRIEIEEPLFVVGLPRSGTSFLQRVLALDERRTTMRLWQLVVAPSVTERKLWGGVAHLDRRIGAPGRRTLEWMGRRLVAWMEDVHPISLTEPEEDFLVLLPAFACFLLVLAFPLHPEVWRLTQIDDWEELDRRRLMAFYRSCLKRHLYAEASSGRGGVRLLSKNPSFTGAVFALAETFPDARFICCVRDPREGVPSQLSAVDEGLEFFGTGAGDPEVRDRFVTMMERYARHALGAGGTLPPDRWAFVRQPDLRSDLMGTVEETYDQFGWELPEEFRRRVQRLSRESRRHESAHSYSAAAFGLSSQELGSRFGPFIDRFGFGREASETSLPSAPLSP